MIAPKYKVAVTHQVKDETVFYEIFVKSDTSEKCTLNRYSELKDFHSQICKCIGVLKLQMPLPEFPKRKLFGSTNKSKEGILSRQIELQAYFSELFSLEKILILPPLQKYLPLEQQNKQFKVSVAIERYSVYDEVVIYFMRFKNKVTKEEWLYKQRYSEIKNLHDALVEQGLKAKLPPFPSRKFFGMTNENPENIEKRREDLETYLNALFSTQEVYDNEVIQYLIADSKKDYEKSLRLEKMKRDSLNKGDLSQKAQFIQQQGEELIKSPMESETQQLAEEELTQN